MSKVNTFGFELLKSLHDNEIQKKEDVIILFIHWYLIKSGMRCIGIENKGVFDASEKGSEQLPKEWNTHPTYTLRYINAGKLYILYGVKSDSDLLVNFMEFENESINNIQFPIEKTVSTLHGSLETVMPTYQTTFHKLQENLVDPIFISCNDVSTQTTSVKGERVTLPPVHDVDQLQHPIDIQTSALRVGRADLYPGGQGGGMIFDPFQRNIPPVPGGLIGVPGRLPPSAIPPGARFDPFGPIDPDPIGPPLRRRPDDDHIPRPGAYDDMFM